MHGLAIVQAMLAFRPIIASTRTAVAIGVMDYTPARTNMVENQLRPNRIEDPGLLAAMLDVPRERFVPKPMRGVAYADEDLRLPDGRYLIEPLGLARLIQTAQVRPKDLVLLLGCSTGYAATILARLAGTVIVLAPDEGSAAQLEGLFDDLAVDNVVVAVSDDPLSGHASQAPFDVILLAGSVEAVPTALLDQIGEGGRLVAVIDGGRVGKGTLFSRRHGVVGHKVVFDAQISPLPGVKPSEAFTF
jgi:protein-L-isoaspartate(D-aspartate) O-methyltransferase